MTWAVRGVVGVSLLLTSLAMSVPASAGEVDHVDPFIGTAPSNVPDPVPGGAMGDVFPGATVPFGAVQWSPDTPGAENDTGYTFADDRIEGFSMVHYSGAGCPNNELLRVMPSLGANDRPALFSHDDESASPGRYAVTLQNGIGVELGTTERAGIGRFTFPASRRSSITLDAFHRNAPFLFFAPARVERVDDRTIRGMVLGGSFCTTPTAFRMYFHAEFDRPFEVASFNPFGTARLEFDTTTDPDVVMKVGLSWVRTANAAENVASEVPGWDLAAVQADAERKWEELLGRVRVAGGSEEQRRVFYTALYHAMLHPNVYSDVNGEYTGFDGRVHSTESGQTHYANFSGWDIYRSQVQLLSVLVPERAEDILRTLVEDARHCGGGFAKWTTFNVETSVMIGDPGALMVANMDAFGAGGIDPAETIEIMERSAYNPRTRCGWLRLRPGLPLYMSQGFTPSLPRALAEGRLAFLWMWLLDIGDVSATMEYAMADAAIAAYAGRHGAPALAADLRHRATSWEEVYDPSVAHVRPRLLDGSFAPGFDPADNYGFTEGNAAQYTWMVPQAYGALVERLGGPAAAAARLDALFEEVNAGLSEPHFYIGNEPLHSAPWAFVWAGAPHGTQEAVRRIINEAFNDSPGGLPGNDDLGATSAWLVWAGLGMYPVVPGEDVLVLNTPLFPEAVVEVPGRGAIRITTGGGPPATYIETATLDGVPHPRAWLRFSDLAAGATVDYTTGPEPAAWGSDPALAPPSLPLRATLGG